MKRKVIVTIASIAGVARNSQGPNFPTQSRGIDVARRRRAGVSIAAMHAMCPDNGATCDADVRRAINERIRDAGCDIARNNSAGDGIHRDMIRELPGEKWEIAFEVRMRGMEAGSERCTLSAAIDFWPPAKTPALYRQPSMIVAVKRLPRLGYTSTAAPVRLACARPCPLSVPLSF
ncbi:3-keto-5-aminohexanoate cleavage protein [Paraburkholderia sp. Ac-20347]|nr:3-keto-5-aminohexanoate cleavage protein [Paraburkholderia sp. Ac-20347]